MKRLVFVSHNEDRPHHDTAMTMVNRMNNVSAPTGDIEYSAWFLEDLVFVSDGRDLRIFNGKTKELLTDFDIVFFLTWFACGVQDIAVSLAHFARSKGLHVLNSEVLNTRSATKLSQQVLAVLNRINTLPFIFAASSQHTLNNLGPNYPMVAKSISASRGNKNYLLKDRLSAEELLQTEGPQKLLFQPFVSNEGDYRLLVMGDSVRLVMHRRSFTGSHLNNTSQGGIARLVPLEDLNQDMLAQSIIAAKMVNREVTGVDMIVNHQTKEFFFLEVNDMPQLSTGSLVPDKMYALDEYLREFTRQ